MSKNHLPCDRRTFLRLTATAAAGIQWAAVSGGEEKAPQPDSDPKQSSKSPGAKVAIAACRTYGAEVKTALQTSFDQLGGIQGLVKNKTVTIKINLTGTRFRPVFQRPVGESYMTHSATAQALASLLIDAGAKRVRIVESANSLQDLESVLTSAGWDINAFNSLGKVEFENTRNLGKNKSYAELPVPGKGHLFFSFQLNPSYEDTDVFISLAKMKNHSCAGVTLSMKNVFGATPNSLYGEDAPSEDAIAGRMPLHSGGKRYGIELPGEIPGDESWDQGYRIPRTVADICAARPIHLAIIDGITTMSGRETPWGWAKFVEPGVIITGLNPVSTDAVGMAVMGYDNPRAAKGTRPFYRIDNHILLAEQHGIGTADLSQIEVLGMPIEKAKCPQFL